MAPPSSVPANAAAVAGRGGSECRICPNPRLTAVAGVRPTPSFYPFTTSAAIQKNRRQKASTKPPLMPTQPPPGPWGLVRG